MDEASTSDRSCLRRLRCKGDGWQPVEKVLSSTASSACNRLCLQGLLQAFCFSTGCQGRKCVSGDDRDRTGNPRLAKPVLSQLSYVPERCMSPVCRRSQSKQPRENLARRSAASSGPPYKQPRLASPGFVPFLRPTIGRGDEPPESAVLPTACRSRPLPPWRMMPNGPPDSNRFRVRGEAALRAERGFVARGLLPPNYSSPNCADRGNSIRRRSPFAATSAGADQDRSLSSAKGLRCGGCRLTPVLSMRHYLLPLGLVMQRARPTRGPFVASVNPPLRFLSEGQSPSA